MILRGIALVGALAVLASCPLGMFTAQPGLVLVYMCLAMPAGALAWAALRGGRNE